MANYQSDDEDPRYSQRQGRRSFPRDDEDQQQPMEQGYGDPQAGVPGGGGGGGGGFPLGGIIAALLKNPRVAMALVAAAVGLFSYLNAPKEFNSVTGQTVRVPWEPKEDVPLGLQAAPGMIQQYGGEHPDRRLQQVVDEIGMRLVKANAVGKWAQNFNYYNWDFHLLADPETINAFALPGGQIFFTFGLYKRLNSEDQIAGVLGHEIGHVIGRHSAQQMAKSKFFEGLGNAGAILTSGQQGGGAGGQVLNHILSSSFGRGHETQSDELGVQFMVNAGFNPTGLVDVMKVLKAAMGDQRQPEFMSSHPDPGNRIEYIQQVIDKIKAGQIKGPMDDAEQENYDRDVVPAYGR